MTHTFIYVFLCFVFQCLPIVWCSSTFATVQTTQRESSDESDTFVVLAGPQLVELLLPVELTELGICDAARVDFRWDEIVDGKLQEDIQQQFDDRVRLVGRPMHRLKAGLIADNHLQLQQALQATDFERISKVDAFCVSYFAARCYENLTAGNRTDALLDFWRLRQYSEAEKSNSLHGTCCAWMVAVSEKDVPIQLLPIWSDGESANETHAALYSCKPTELGESNKDVFQEVHLAALELAAVRYADVESRVASWRTNSDSEFADWILVFKAANELSQGQASGSVISLTNEVNRMSPAAKVVGKYWLNKAAMADMATTRAKSPEQARRAMLQWLLFADSIKSSDPYVAVKAVVFAREIASQNGWQSDVEKLQLELDNKFATVQVVGK